ncbi:MAG TPA: YjbQ family protein [Candidatus Marinimicrobia bacterium]|nr:YjbQ family protein [Candidatus Neomarinimicrobiota bacterium]
MVYGKKIILQTHGFSDIQDITQGVQQVVTDSQCQAGIVTVSAIGSTASVTTIEFEPALVQDMQEQLEKFASRSMHSRHSQTWGDDNGFSHLRASFMGPGITVPFSDGKLVLGTWQQIVVIDHDNRPRQRQVYIQVLGE